jgi:hypothetical protein
VESQESSGEILPPQLERSQFAAEVGAAYINRMGLPEASRLGLDVDLGALFAIGRTTSYGHSIYRVLISASGGLEIQPEGGAFHVGGRLTVLAETYLRMLAFGFSINPRATWFEGSDTAQFECVFDFRAGVQLEFITLSLSAMIGLNVEDTRRHFIGTRFGIGFAVP